MLVVACLSFAPVLTTLVPALDELRRGLQTEEAGVAWALAAYLVSAAVCTPVFGRLGDMFGKRKVLVCSLSIFAAGGVVAGLGDTVGVVVAGRVLQGAGGGVFPLAFGIAR